MDRNSRAKDLAAPEISYVREWVQNADAYPSAMVNPPYFTQHDDPNYEELISGSKTQPLFTVMMNLISRADGVTKRIWDNSGKVCDETVEPIQPDIVSLNLNTLSNLERYIALAGQVTYNNQAREVAHETEQVLIDYQESINNRRAELLRLQREARSNNGGASEIDLCSPEPLTEEEIRKRYAPVTRRTGAPARLVAVANSPTTTGFRSRGGSPKSVAASPKSQPTSVSRRTPAR
jgi:hypothetical protein